MEGFARTYADALATALYRGGTFVGPANLFLLPHLEDPGSDGTFNLSSITVRKPVDWDAPVEPGRVRLSYDLLWSPSQAATGLTLTYFSLWTATSGTNFYGSGHFVNAVTTSSTGLLIPKGTLAGQVPAAGDPP